MIRFGLIAAAALLALGPGVAEARTCRGSTLLPTIASYPPQEVKVERLDDDGRRHWGLTFGTALGNFGRGPLTMIGRRRTRATPVMRTRQVIRCAKGPSVRRGDTGGMRFARVPTHFHWHLRDLERYRLVSLDDGRSYYAGKRGFCLGDSYSLEIALPNTPRRRQFAGDLTTACAKNKPRAKYVRLGLSVGWGDSYPPIIEGQYVDLDGVGPGTYRLLMEVDPFKRIRMGSRAKVTAGVDLALSYPQGPGGEPAIEQLGECLTVKACSRPAPSTATASSGLAGLGRAPEGFTALGASS